jgi:MFS family permease
LLLSHLFDTGRPGPDDRWHLYPLGHFACHHRCDLGFVHCGDADLCGAIVFFFFFFASAGASSAYLTVSEIFPLETRALCIAFFYGVGTAAGGIAGPLLFGALIQNASSSGDITKIAVGYFIGAALMVAGGVVEAIFGVSAERQALENIAMPLTAADPEGQTDAKRPAASPA